MEHHSNVAHAAYIDLRRSLMDSAVSDIQGTPTLVVRGRRKYWYDSYRVGTEVKKRYIGEDSDDLRQRLDRYRDIKAEEEARRKSRTRLVRILRAEGFMGIDAGTGSILNAMAGAGVFRLGGTVVGTHAFRLYEGELGVRYGFDETAQTGDVDIASFERLSLALDDQVDPPLEEVLSDFSFTPAPTLDKHRSFRWQQSRKDLLVEFLTPSFSAEEGLRRLEALGVDAQALHHLNYLIAEPIKAVALYRSGVLVQVPRPERFAIHKLIVADRRRDGIDGLKSRKDVAQAKFLVGVLAHDRPDELSEALEDARSRGPRWRDRISATLEREPEIAQTLSELA
ncbi:GSU2403 family nucleotidyltransferase fold protein [Qingshengfaniella alkalisoli]|uniref:Uncharacterized protein n=1 Tax=Qingshengfaniella alkalisoli TaxID=2599296 RepID=A0A5B8JAN1_9RHOB|nr:GSU2403 family nucleotidyltransferase fold protein [Qingshengfaniella alkalisoli]QDY71347.1 hypothetical protein FPZ52_16735 [Qingshengfaniella alkalisoli]